MIKKLKPSKRKTPKLRPRSAFGVLSIPADARIVDGGSVFGEDDPEKESWQKRPTPTIRNPRL